MNPLNQRDPRQRCYELPRFHLTQALVVVPSSFHFTLAPTCKPSQDSSITERNPFTISSVETIQQMAFVPTQADTYFPYILFTRTKTL